LINRNRQGLKSKKHRSRMGKTFLTKGRRTCAADRWDPVATLAAELANLAMPVT
jgi:hypothetical protein